MVGIGAVEPERAAILDCNGKGRSVGATGARDDAAENGIRTRRDARSSKGRLRNGMRARVEIEDELVPGFGVDFLRIVCEVASTRGIYTDIDILRSAGHGDRRRKGADGLTGCESGEEGEGDGDSGEDEHGGFRGWYASAKDV